MIILEILQCIPAVIIFAFLELEQIFSFVDRHEIIETYPDDKPYPSALCHGIWQNQVLHVVMAYDLDDQKIYVITAYWPDEEHFDNDLKTRREL